MWGSTWYYIYYQFGKDDEDSDVLNVLDGSNLASKVCLRNIFDKETSNNK